MVIEQVRRNSRGSCVEGEGVGSGALVWLEGEREVGMKSQRKVCLIEYKEIKGYDYLLLTCNLLQICKLKPYFESFIYH